MADTKTYKEGDEYEVKYPNAPRSFEGQYKIGTQLTIRDGDNGPLLAIWEVTETDENGAKGKIIRVFKVKAPVDPRKKGPAGNREVKPL